MELENKIKEIQVSEKSVEFGVDWLKEKSNHALEANGLSDLVRYLLVEVQTLKDQLKKQNG